MAKESERMRRMKANFMGLHEEGYTIPEIAKQFSLARATVYHVLQEIADTHDVSRESLLQIVRRPSEGGRNYRNEDQRVKVNVNELQKEFENAIAEINSLISAIEETLQQEEENE